jgi:ketol-acid reductoisomerase
MIIPITSAATIAIPSPAAVDHRIDGAVVYSLVPASDITLTIAPDGLFGQMYFLKITTTGTTSRTLTFSTGFKVTATLATGTVDAKVFVIPFISDGQLLIEASLRTTAM